MYTTLGPEWEKTFVRMAIETLTTAATKHTAHFFFTNRTVVGTEMQRALSEQFDKHAFAEIPFLQLRTVQLPPDFDHAIKETQVAQQDIQVAKMEQNSNRVRYQTEVLRATKRVEVINNQAAAEAASIMAENQAYCKQYSITQDLQSQALQELKLSAGWTSKQLLEYLRIRAVRDHPANKTTVRM